MHRSSFARFSFGALLLAGAACAPDAGRVLAPGLQPGAGPSRGLGAASPVVISQVYGGGGNAGTVYKNDFIELYNPGANPVSLDGWSVQYASASGTTWQVTTLSGSIAAGGYYLVQEAAGTTTGGGATPLPTPNATGTIPMAAGAGKVALVSGTAALTGTACPIVYTGGIVDYVGYGTGSGGANCFEGATAAPTLTNPNSDSRGAGGQDTNNNGGDFTAGPATPHNGTSTGPVAGPLDHVTISASGTVVIVGATLQLTAIAKDANEVTVPGATFLWSTSDPAVATVDQTGKVTGVAASATPVTITATATANGITRSATQLVTVNAAGIAWIDASSSTSSFPPGFQTQVFLTARVASGGTIVPATFAIEALDPGIATAKILDNTAIITGVSGSTTKPRFRITATPVAGGTPYVFTTSSLVTIETPVVAPASIYSKNDEFGDPTPATPSSTTDMLIARAQYTLSYNQARGTPNWVAYELDTRQFGGEDRCNCFTADPLLPDAKQIYTSDYTNGGYDRGHMTRSADRTAANVDNATTFYLTNVVPQQGDLNQGVWAQFENALADSAKAGRAVYIVTGPLYSASKPLQYLKNEGKVAIPDSTWKVAFIGPRTAGTPFARGDVTTWDALAGTTVLAVNMPNVAGVRNDPWSKYLTTVDKIETSTGYDVLSLLPVAFQAAVEAGDHAPTAAFATPAGKTEGQSITFDGTASSDPDAGDVLTYAWNFGDGTTGVGGAQPTHTFADEGEYTVALTVSDKYGWQKLVTHTVTIGNVAPVVAAFPGATLMVGETYTATGTFTDPGADTWRGTVNYGDGSWPSPLAIWGHTFSLSHTYTATGTRTVTVTVTDGDGGSSTRTAQVVVLTPEEALRNLTDMISDVEGLSQGEAQALGAPLKASTALLRTEGAIAVKGQLGAVINQVAALLQSGRISKADADALTAYAQRIIASLS
jgi:DNA/RNA endonuclease G (NUC1)